jgi:hypothetical protein
VGDDLDDGGRLGDLDLLLLGADISAGLLVVGEGLAGQPLPGVDVSPPGSEGPVFAEIAGDRSPLAFGSGGRLEVVASRS